MWNSLSVIIPKKHKWWCQNPKPVAVFDMSLEAQQARVEAVAEAFYKEEEDWGWSMPWKSITGDCRTECLATARAALLAIFPSHPTDKKGAK